MSIFVGLTNHALIDAIIPHASGLLPVHRCGPAGANRCLRTASTIVPASGSRPPRASAAIRSVRAPAACNSTRNAGIPAASAQLVRITHPFHPLTGRQLPCVGERYNRSGKRLLLRVDDKTVCSVPPQWTDTIASDPEAAIGQGRALFRVSDLLELADLVTRLSRERDRDASGNV